jgi:hypothetical protein
VVLAAAWGWVLFAGPGARAAEPALLYEWTDPVGIVRYTPDPSRVPGSLRGSTRQVVPGMAPAPLLKDTPAAAHEGTAPVAAAVAAPAVATPPPDSGEIAYAEPDPFNAPESARHVESETVEFAPATRSAVAATATPAAAVGSGEAGSDAGGVDAPENAPVVAIAGLAVGADDAEAVGSGSSVAPTDVPESAAVTAHAVGAGDTEAVGSGSSTAPTDVPESAAATAHAVGADDAEAVGSGVAADVSGGSGVSAAPADVWTAATTPAVSAAAWAPEPATGEGAQDPRIRELEEAIARDEETIKQLISAPASGEVGDSPLGNEQLREVAMRLPKLQAELRALRATDGADAPR